MSEKECLTQLISLIEHFNNGGLDFNATDVVAIKCLISKNKKYEEVFDKLKKFLKEDVEKERKYLYEKSDKFFEGKDFGDKGYGCAIQCVQAIQDYLLDILKEVE